MILLSHLSHARLATTSRSVIKVILVNQQTLKSKDSICTIKEAQSGLIYVVAYVKPHPPLDNGKMVEGRVRLHVGYINGCLSNTLLLFSVEFFYYFEAQCKLQGKMLISIFTLTLLSWFRIHGINLQIYDLFVLCHTCII